MKGRSSKAWVKRGFAAAGRGPDRTNYGMSNDAYKRAREFDRQRKEDMLECAKSMFQRFPVLSKTGNLTGGEIKYLVYGYRLSPSVCASIKVNREEVSPVITGRALDVKATLDELTSMNPELVKAFRIDTQGVERNTRLSDLGVLTVTLAGLFKPVDFWAPFLAKLEQDVAALKAA